MRQAITQRIMRQRREFLRKALGTAYAVPLVVSFAQNDLVRAQSCPGLGDCGNHMASDMSQGKGFRTP